MAQGGEEKVDTRCGQDVQRAKCHKKIDGTYIKRGFRGFFLTKYMSRFSCVSGKFS